MSALDCPDDRKLVKALETVFFVTPPAQIETTKRFQITLDPVFDVESRGGVCFKSIPRPDADRAGH